MNHRGWAPSGFLVSLVCVTVMLAACGNDTSGWNGMGTEGGDYASDSNSAVLVGVSGVAWSATSTPSDGTTKTTTSGVTNDAGKFEVGSQEICTTTTDSQGTATQSCDYTSYEAPSLSIGGVSLPPLESPLNGYATARYALLDFGAAAFNVASFILMGNSNSGDPLANGIQLSTGFSTTDCQPFDWSTENIQQDAACFLTQANKDGVQHSWPSADTVNQFLQSQWLHVHAGMYYGDEFNTATAAYPTPGSLFGNANAVVEVDGTTVGWLDYTGDGNRNNLPGVPWSGSLALTSEQGGSLIDTTGSTAPIPNMTVNFDVSVNGAEVTYQTADGSLAGTTERSDEVGAPAFPGMYLDAEPAISFPKYHFLEQNVSYTRPGQSSPDNYVLYLVIGYGSYVEGELDLWPPQPLGTAPPMYLEMYGQLNKDNTVTLHWFQDNITKKVPTSKAMTLTFDPNAVTLSGELIGYDGTPWTTITIQGWRT